MKNFLIKNKKIFFISLPLFLVFWISYMAIYKTETLVGMGFSLFTKGGLKIEKLTFQEGSNKERGRIELKNSKLYGENKELIADIPQLSLTYDNWKITSIDIYDPEINFVRDRNSYNIVDIFTGGKKKANAPQKESEEKIEKTEDLSEPILKKINVYNANLLYQDESYTEKIEKAVDNVNGYIKFYNGYRTDLEFTGVGKENNNEKIFVKYDSSTGKYAFYLDLKNIDFNEKLFQYAYDSNGAIKDVYGLANLKLKISDEGFLGEATLENGGLKYEDLDMPVTNVKLDIKFLGEQILIDGDYLVGNYPGKFSLDYNNENGVKVGFFLKDILYKDVEKYKYLKSLNLGFENLKLDKADIILSYKDKFRADIDFESKNGDNLDILYFEDVSGRFTYVDDTFYLENLKTSLSINDKFTSRKVVGNLKLKDGKGETKLKVLGDKRHLLSNFDLDFNFEIAENNFLFDIKSKILNLNGDYDFEKKEIILKEEDDFYLKYNLKEKILEESKGDITAYFNGYTIKSNLKLDRDKNELGIASNITRDNKKTDGKIDVKINLDTFNYITEFDLNNIRLVDKSGTLAGSFKGKIENKNDTLEGQIFIEKGLVVDNQNGIRIRKIYGITNINNKNKDKYLDITFDGEVGKLITPNITLNGLKIGIRYFDKEIQIKNINNRYLGATGTLFLDDLSINGNIKFNGINQDVVKLGDFNYEITDASGQISGKITPELDKLKGDILVKDAHLLLGESVVDFHGNIKYLNREISSKEFFIGENTLDFLYSIKNKKGSYDLIINENEIINIIPGTKLKLIGKSEGILENGYINGDFYGEIEGIRVGENYLPKISLTGKYDNNYINFRNISFLLKDGRKIINTKGKIDIHTKELEFELPEQNINLKDLNLFKDLNIQMLTKGKLKGTFDNLEYEIISEKGKIYFKNKFIANEKFKIFGDKEFINIEKINLFSDNNKIDILGNYNIKDKLTNGKIEAKIKEVDSLKEIAEKYNIENLSGKIDLDFEFIDNIPKGSLKFNKFKADMPNFNLYINNVNGNLGIDRRKIVIDSFDGNINDGKLKVFGDVVFEDTLEYLIGDNFEKIRYNLTLEGKNINYLYKDFVKINFSTRLRLVKDNLFGTININSGKITNITDKNFGIISTIKEYLKRKSMKSNPIVKNTAVFSPRGGLDISPSEIETNIKINIENGVNIDIKDISGYVKDIKGEVNGSGVLKGTLENLNFLGETNIKEGEFIFNNRKFYIDSAAALFNNPNQTIENINPEIVFITKTTINSKIYEISLIGPARNMELYIKSGDDVAISDLNSILSSDKNKNLNQKEMDETTAILIAELVGGQISDIVVSPIVDVVRTLFGFSDLRVSSSIITQDKKKNRDDELGVTFGAYIEAESPIYKDKIYWRAKFNFVDTTSELDRSPGEYGIAEYDLGVYYKINKNLSWGVGAQKIRNDLEILDSDKNYYIEMNFEKKFDF
ncbi:translocation/assembly module TamB domain-containing protein [Fusobacterium perfoetens]|uniref:translocation/assembly module TamB domain-containing protein n=1 Tax=Fusobacterium perfoetens TaxID=852 RepID=UPI000489D97C|nr:hypothetical protein [Fusobacterium perfoetens]